MDKSLPRVTRQDVEAAQYIWLHEPLYHLKYDVSMFFKFTILRDPEERVFSHYRHLSDPEHLRQQDLSTMPDYLSSALKQLPEMTFEEFVLSEDPGHRFHISNLYVKYFSNSNVKDDSTDECIENMRANFAYVGTTETLEEDMGHIRRLCFPRFPHDFGERRVNVSRNRVGNNALSDRASAVLDERIGIDRALYDHARQLRQEILSRDRPSVLRRVFRGLLRS